jgi:geranylgeranyl pyrophosphate synthase
MGETAGKAYPLLSRCIDSVKAIDPELHRIMRYVVDRRNNDLLLKPFLLRLAYELCGGSNWEKTVPVGAAFELLNISSYQANSSFDNKHAVLTLPDKNSQFIASMVTRELCLECLSAAEADFEGAVLDEIRADLSNCNKHIYIAQHYDLNLLKTDRFHCYVDEDIFMKEYISRCFHGSGIFAGRCARAGALLAGAPAHDCAALQKFGEDFGTGIQIMNDLADFVPPGVDGIIGRGFQDQFSDIRNGRLTLGCYLLFTNWGQNGKSLSRHILCKAKFSEKEKVNIAKLIAHSGTLDTVRMCARSFAKKAKHSLATFPDVPQRAHLSLMTCVCHHNKYLKALKRNADSAEGTR